MMEDLMYNEDDSVIEIGIDKSNIEKNWILRQYPN